MNEICTEYLLITFLLQCMHLCIFLDTFHCFLEVDVTSGHSAPVLPPLELPVGPPPDTVGTPLSTPTSPALSDDSDCLFCLDVDNVRSLLPQDITALPPVLKIVNEGMQQQQQHFFIKRKSYRHVHNHPQIATAV